MHLIFSCNQLILQLLSNI